MRERAAVLREASRLQGLFRGPPIPVELIAQEQGISVLRRGDLPCSGRLMAVRGGFELHVAAHERPDRQRFTIAHEIAHTFFSPNLQKNREAGAIPVLLGYNDDQTVEKLCDIAASELLIPPGDLAVLAESASPSFDAFQEIRRVFQVSIRALVVALPQVSPRWVFLMCKYSTRPGSSEKKLRVLWSSTPKGTFVPKHDSIGEHSGVGESFLARRRWQGWDTLDLGSLRGQYQVDCVPLGEDQQLVIVDVDSKSGTAPLNTTAA